MAGIPTLHYEAPPSVFSMEDPYNYCYCPKVRPVFHLPRLSGAGGELRGGGAGEGRVGPLALQLH